MENLAYQDINDNYYNIEKKSIYSLIPEGPHCILDLGCATGRVGQNLMALNKAKTVVGVEIFKDAAEEAGKRYQKVYHGDIEELTLDYKEYFDFVLCLDILEHLKDPWTILERIYGWLKINGQVIAIVPNIRYWRILFKLIFWGQWEYADSGILDKTHLRFFTFKTFKHMLTSKKFTITQKKIIIHGKKKNFFNRITFNIFRNLLGYQILAVGKKIHTV